ncbi:MAG: sodium/solute symporter [Bacteroidota bacterium]
MLLDLLIVLAYFITVFVVAISGRMGKDVTTEEYFLSSRNLKWYSVAISTIATNVQGYQFLGMMGSAYLYGLAQGNLEINAIQGLWMAAFIFIPLYLKDKVITVTQFIKNRLGTTASLFYSISNIVLFSTIALGGALFWGAYAADLVFGDYLSFIHEDRTTRVSILLAGLGIFSAIYTYFGGLAAVVKTDLIQFGIIVLGGIAVLVAALNHLGGWGQLYEKTPELMHLHLPADHPQLPWIAIVGWFLLNINYWCANQSVVQRSLAAKSLKEAQIGLLAGGVLKYFMAILIIVPGIALAGILSDNPLADPDQTFPYLVTNYLPTGMRGIILCALFASLMSTVDSTFNSLATLWSVDIYKGYIKKEATDQQMVAAGRQTILVTLFTGVLTGFMLLYSKFSAVEVAFTHTLNELRYYIIGGIVVLICVAGFVLKPNYRLVIAGFISTFISQYLLQTLFPDMNYFVRASWVIGIGFLIVALPALFQKGMRPLSETYQSASPQLTKVGIGLLLSLGALHLIFH